MSRSPTANSMMVHAFASLFPHFLISAASAVVGAFKSAVVGFLCDLLTTLSKLLSCRIAFMQIFHSAWSSLIFRKEDSIPYEIVGLSVWFLMGCWCVCQLELKQGS